MVIYFIKARIYPVINGDIFCKGKDLSLKKVPMSWEIESILKAFHDCGGHFAKESTNKKIVHACLVWPSPHMDV